MKSLLELIPYLNGYPIWVRAVLLGLPPLYAFAFVLLSIFAPTAALQIEMLRRFATPNDVLAIDVTVRNPASSLASMTAAVVELYADPKPSAGLLSSLRVSATYSVTAGDNSTVVHSDKDRLPQPAAVLRPYANNPYTRVTLPISQTVKAGEVDRFMISLNGPGIILPTHTSLELRIDYDDGKESLPKTIKLN